MFRTVRFRIRLCAEYSFKPSPCGIRFMHYAQYTFTLPYSTVCNAAPSSMRDTAPPYQ